MMSNLILVSLLLCMFFVSGGLGLNVSSCIEKERQALLDVKANLTDPNGDLDGEMDCCKWARVTCDILTGHVTELRLYQLGGVGKISPSLQVLTQLEYLSLSFIDFQCNPLPAFLGSLSNLQELYISSANLCGPIPHQLANLSNLLELVLSNNSLEGSIPHSFGDLTSLSILDMSGNQFSGNVPNSLGQLSNLDYLDLSSNSLEGVISEVHFLNLTQLQYLDLSLNSNLTLDLRFHGESPFQLRTVKLRSCKLGPKFPIWIKTQKDIWYLDISNAGISDNMPTWFSDISNWLFFMNLSSNEIKGILPDMSNFGSSNSIYSGTVGIDLSYNNIEGKVPLLPPKLTTLNLSGNRFSGTLSFLCEIEEITFLDLSNNSFSGSLPDCWAKFQNTLVVLNLANNNLSGKIPSSLGFLSSLEAMYLRTNAFVGEVPLSLSNCTRLRFLDLWGNKLSGFIPEWIGEALSELFVLDLGSNRFCGRLSSQVCWLRNLQVLDLSDNELSGNMPTCFSGLSSKLRFLNLSSNEIKGILPDMSNIGSSNSEYNGSVGMDLSCNYFEGKVPLLPPRLSSLILSGNRFSGTLSFLCEIEEFLTFLDLSKNSFSGSLPDCWLKFQKTLEVLNLSNNNLSGKIPSSLGSLSRLEALYLRTNALVGEVPFSLSNCTRLRFLDLWGNKLSGFIPEWIGEALSELYVLDLGSNRFCGRLPSQVCWLRNLQVLDLSDNELSGNILGCFDNFTAMATKNVTNDMSSHFYFSYVGFGFGFVTCARNGYCPSPLRLEKARSSHNAWVTWKGIDLYSDNALVTWKGIVQYSDNAWVTWKGTDRSFGRKSLQLLKSIDLSRNNLSGEVPHEVTRLYELVSLNLSINKLHGEVPKDIGRLKYLESLDLSRNKFSGRIPSSLSELTFLSYLNLSLNDLSGRIPTGSQLQRFDCSSYAGNPQLRGPPLTPGCGNSPAVEKKAIEEDEDDCWKSYYTGMGSGFAAGFLGICGVIIANRRCRYIIFASLSYIKDWIYVTVVVYFGKLGRKFRR